MNILSRSEAISQKASRYFTGLPCKHGHLCERTVSNGCVECVRKQALSGHEVDHIAPLLGKTVSGLHVFKNLQYLTTHDNRAKRNKFI